MIKEETARAQGAKHPSTCEWRHQDTANGELETKTNRDTNEEWIFAYDLLGNLLSVGLPNGDLVEYLVDGMGRRVGKKKNGVLLKQWIYRDALKPVAELDGSGALVSEFVYGSKGNVPDYVRRGGATYRVISDQLGSPRYVVNVANAGDVAFSANYSSFGEPSGIGLDWLLFGFAGGIYDRDTGLTRFGARDMDPSIGRWTGKDPIRFDSGQLNIFAYVYNDPLNRKDPTGLAVYLCGRVTEDPRLHWTGEPHEWIYTDSNGAIGMWDCPTNHDNGRYCFFSDVCVTPTPDLMYHPGTTCELIPDANEECVNSRLTPGANLGCWNPVNECQTFARNVLSSCEPISPACSASFDGGEGGPNACY